MAQDKIKEITDDIIHRLSHAGFTIQKYNAYSTDSVYLKLDYGVCNSIRISNHEGKKYLNYRYNIIIDGETKDIMSKYIRHYYHQDDIDDMIELIKAERQTKLAKYGQHLYHQFMKENQSNHSTDKQGFWRQSTCILPYSK